MNPLLFSVIMPVYNGGNYIKDAIESVLNQTLSDLELIIVNDCSTDTTKDIILSYNDNRIKYYENSKNLGVAATRNFGVSVATGKWVAFLDADDFWDLHKLEKQHELMLKTGCRLCYTAREFILDDGTKTGITTKAKRKLTFKQLLWHNYIPCSSVVLPRKIALKYKMNNDSLHEDYTTWLTILKKYKVACGVNKPLLKYRLSDGGKSRKLIKSAKMTYAVYKSVGLNPLSSFIHMTTHLLHGVYNYKSLILSKITALPHK